VYHYRPTLRSCATLRIYAHTHYTHKLPDTSDLTFFPKCDPVTVQNEVVSIMRYLNKRFNVLPYVNVDQSVTILFVIG